MLELSFGLSVKSELPRVVYLLYSKVVMRLLALGSTATTLATAKTAKDMLNALNCFSTIKRIDSPNATATSKNAK